MSPVSFDLNRTTGLPSLGTHVFKVTNVTESESDSGYTNILVQCTVQDAGDDQGRQALLNVSPDNPRSRWKFDEFLDALDLPKKGKGNAGMFMGKMFRANVSHDEWEGKVRARLDNFMPYSASAPGTPAMNSVGRAPVKTSPKPSSSGLPKDSKSNDIPF